MKKLLLIIIFLISCVESVLIKTNDFCINNKLEIKKEIKCHGNYSLSCGDIVCAKDRYKCQSLTVFSKTKNFQKNDQDLFFSRKNYESFFRLIKNCPQPKEYKWNPNDVCLNPKNCVKLSIHRMWSQLHECNCIGNYDIKCSSDYCASNRQACDGLKKAASFKYKKCKQTKNHL